jgi:hypothetical protein
MFVDVMFTEPTHIGHGSTNVTYIPTIDNTSFSNPMNVLSCSNVRNGIVVVSLTKSFACLAFDIECTVTSPMSTQHLLQELPKLDCDSPTKKLKPLKLSIEE